MSDWVTRGHGLRLTRGTLTPALSRWERERRGYGSEETKVPRAPSVFLSRLRQIHDE